MRVRWLAFAFVLGCGGGLTSLPAAPRPTCEGTHTVHVVDETGAPLAGARVKAVARFMACGPSGLPEGCGNGEAESPTVTTDAAGAASFCVPHSGGRERMRSTTVDVDYRDWPLATMPLERAEVFVMGPARTALVEVPVACKDFQHVHVRALPVDGGAQVWAKQVPGGLGLTARFQLGELGPGRYWIQSTDDRSGNDACAAFTRALDGRAIPPTLALDRDDALVERPDFGGGTATLADGKIIPLDAAGRATVTLPGRQIMCTRLERAGRCEMTFARGGEVARPQLYAGREREIAQRCGSCP